MALRKSTGNMYEWITHTWNPIKGKCPHNCSYCYVKRWGEQKPPRLDEKEFKVNLGSGNTIFVCSGIDMFANGISSAWIIDTLKHCQRYKNTYLFQSKNPERFKYFASHFPIDNNFHLCVTLESNRQYKEMVNSPLIKNRVYEMSEIQDVIAKMITIEPIMDFDIIEFVQMIDDIKPQKINIGADSGNNNLSEPTSDKLQAFITILQGKGYKVNLKKNIKRLFLTSK